MATPCIFSCRWDWCRSTFPSIDALDTHVKHEHIWPMKPMRKAEIALMRRMDLQSLHSSQDTDSSIISRGLLASVPRSKTAPPAAPLASVSGTDESPESETFETFTQLSSPPQTQSPQKLPVSPAFESLMKRDGRSGLTAAIEMLERNYGHRGNKRARPPSLGSPTRRPPSNGSTSSQEVVEQELTQEDDPAPHPLPPVDPQIDDELANAELTWPPSDDELPENPEPENPLGEQLGSSLGPSRGQNFHCGPLNVPLGLNSPSPGSHAPGVDSQDSEPSSQPMVLQTQAPYSSQTGWSGTQ